MILSPSSFALNSSGLSDLACIPSIMVSRFDVILSGNQPSFRGSRPYDASLDFDGSNISSSEPVIMYPFL